VKIAFLLERFLPYTGGIPLRAYKIAKGLTEKAHEVTVYTATHPHAPQSERIDGIEVRRHNFIGNGDSPFARFLKAPHGPLMPQLVTLFCDKKINDVDIVQSFMFMSYVTLTAASIKLAQKKIFVLAPYCPPDYRGIPGFSTNKSMVVYRLTLGAAILRYADYHITETSRETNNLILGFGVHPNKIQVIPDGIESEKYQQLPDDVTFKEKYKIVPNAKIILFVGFPLMRKGLPHLLLAMNRVLKKIKGVTLLLVGPKPRRARLMVKKFGSSIVQNHTVVTGYISERSLTSIYLTSDVFVLPSFLEGFGRVIAEAAAAGLPIVCTKTGATPDLVIQGENGLFVEYGNVDQISNAIIRVLTDSNFKRQAGKRREFIWEHYDHKKEIDQYEKAYRRLIQRAS
jgi:glycosyltransferase involved in cell wall biosynthesis